MGVLDFLSGVVKPITDLIDNLTTTDEERGKLQNELTIIENEFLGKALEYEAKLLDSRGRIVEAEAKGQILRHAQDRAGCRGIGDQLRCLLF